MPPLQITRADFAPPVRVSDTRVRRPPSPAGAKHAVSPGRLSVPPAAPRQAPSPGGPSCKH